MGRRAAGIATVLALALAVPGPARAGDGDGRSAPERAESDPTLRGPAPRADDPEDEEPEPQPEPAQTPEERPQPELMPRRTLAESAGWTFPAEPEPSDPEERIEAREDQWLREQLGQDRLEHTGADRWYHRMGQQMRRHLEVDPREALRERRRGMSPLQRVVDELGRYAHGPEGVTDRNRNMPPVETETTDGNARNEQRYMYQRRLTNAPVRWEHVDVRLVHAPDGDLLASWITESSGNEVLDQAVLKAVREGATELRPPPQAVVGERLNIVSEWRFEIGDVATFLTEAGCVMNPEGGVDCAALGRGIMRTRVKLLKVIDGQNPDAATRRRERRRLVPRRRR